mmetsp:Transcript_4145/g.14028  ORF Transcript_4145/g.14028 Transcript_4145/m.14028 type:complete len:159 (+) Transcript_4145:1253-1729(+)
MEGAAEANFADFSAPAAAGSMAEVARRLPALAFARLSTPASAAWAWAATFTAAAVAEDAASAAEEDGAGTTVGDAAGAAVDAAITTNCEAFAAGAASSTGRCACDAPTFDAAGIPAAFATAGTTATFEGRRPGFSLGSNGLARAPVAAEAADGVQLSA